MMTNFIAAQGVTTDFIRLHPDKLPGLYAIHTDVNGERSFSYWRENSAARSLFEDGFDVLAEFDVIYLSGITLAILPATIRQALLSWLADWPGLVVFDSNFRPRLWSDKSEAKDATEKAWCRCDLGLPSVDDEIAMFGDKDEAAVLRRLARLGVTRGALKRGDKGPVGLAGAARDAMAFPRAPQVVDTTAAGDSFNGAYLAAILSGAGEDEALMAGHLCALEVIGHMGAIIPFRPK